MTQLNRFIKIGNLKLEKYIYNYLKNRYTHINVIINQAWKIFEMLFFKPVKFVFVKIN